MFIEDKWWFYLLPFHHPQVTAVPARRCPSIAIIEIVLANLLRKLAIKL